MRAKKWPGRLLLIAGLALLAFYLGARIDSAVRSRKQLREFEQARAIATSPPEQPRRASPAVDFSLWSPQRVKAYEESRKAEVGPALAVLRVPKIGLEVPVLAGTDDLSLNRGVGWIAGTARPGGPGNIGIAGHRDGFFRGLKDVAVGDALELRTFHWSETYVVDDIRVVRPQDTFVLKPGKVRSVTLVTCYPFYVLGAARRRYIVHASFQDPATASQAALQQAGPGGAMFHDVRERER